MSSPDSSPSGAVAYRCLFNGYDGLMVCKNAWFRTAADAELYLLNEYTFAYGGRVQRFVPCGDSYRIKGSYEVAQ